MLTRFLRLPNTPYDSMLFDFVNKLHSQILGKWKLNYTQDNYEVVRACLKDSIYWEINTLRIGRYSDMR